MIEISKELLLEIMPLDENEEYDEYYKTKINKSLHIGYAYKIIYNNNYVGSGAKHLNIYELAHKCKQWALSKDYHINTSEDKFNNYLYLYKMIKDDFGYSIDKINGVQFDSNSYINDLVKACEWIREQIK